MSGGFWGDEYEDEPDEPEWSDTDDDPEPGNIFDDPEDCE